MAHARRHSASDCRVLSDSKIECLTVEGTGGPHHAIVHAVGGQSSSISSASLSYGSPVITDFSGPASNGASTLGGQTITIEGLNFGANSGDVDDVWCRDGVDDTLFKADNCTVAIPHRQLHCRTPQGPASSRLDWQVVVDGMASTAPYTSSASPTISAVSLVDGSSASTSGGDRFLVSGSEFGVRDDRIASVTLVGPGTESVAQRGVTRHCRRVQTHVSTCLRTD